MPSCLPVVPLVRLFNLLSSSVLSSENVQGEQRRRLKGYPEVTFNCLFIRFLAHLVVQRSTWTYEWCCNITHIYLMHTFFSGLTRVRLIKTEANMKTFMPFLREWLLIITLSWNSFSCLLDLNIGMKCSFQSLASINQCAQHTAPRLCSLHCLLYPRFHFLLDATWCFCSIWCY